MRFGFHSKYRCADEIKDLPISIDFQASKHGVVTSVYYYISMIKVISNDEFSHFRQGKFQLHKQ